MCNSADSEISSQEDRSTFDKNYEPSSQSLMSGEMTESEANLRESTMADNEDGVLDGEDGEVESSNGEVEVNLRLQAVVMTCKMRRTKYYSLINIFQAPFP